MNNLKGGQNDKNLLVDVNRKKCFHVHVKNDRQNSSIIFHIIKYNLAMFLTLHWKDQRDVQQFTLAETHRS